LEVRARRGIGTTLPDPDVCSVTLPGCSRSYGRLMAPNGDSVADLEAHEILTDLQGTDVSRASANVVEGRRPDAVAGELDHVRSTETTGPPALESKLV
jgi:hypothetical protein